MKTESLARQTCTDGSGALHQQQRKCQHWWGTRMLIEAVVVWEWCLMIDSDGRNPIQPRVLGQRLRRRSNE